MRCKQDKDYQGHEMDVAQKRQRRFDGKYADRLENALKPNGPLMKAYCLKEGLREIWNRISKADAEKELGFWIQQAIDTRLQPMLVMANTLKVFRRFIPTWYDYPISNGPIEGTNNKIKVLEEAGYGFRKDEFFTLKLYAYTTGAYASNGRTNKTPTAFRESNRSNGRE